MPEEQEEQKRGEKRKEKRSSRPTFGLLGVRLGQPVDGRTRLRLGPDKVHLGREEEEGRRWRRGWRRR